MLKRFGDVYERQYAVALFNSVRFEIEGGGRPQSQLLHRKASTAAAMCVYTVCVSKKSSTALIQMKSPAIKKKDRVINHNHGYQFCF